jgi:exodeoxyribonuclease VII small subunit
MVRAPRQAPADGSKLIPDGPAFAGLTFERALAELEKLVGRMEGGDLSLEDSLAAHKRGLELARFCQDRLESAQQQVRVLEGEVLKSLSSAQAPEPGDD